MGHRTLVVWFRRDLRVADQAALWHAVHDAAQVVPLFILDPALLRKPHVGGSRLAFLLSSVQQLDQQLRALGSALVVRSGEPVEVLLQILAETQAEGVYFNRDYVWPGRDRDAQVERVLRERGAQVRTFQDQVLVEPESLLTAAGRPYTVFTPYKKAWLRLAKQMPLPLPQGLTSPALDGVPLPAIQDFALQAAVALPEPGEHAARMLLRRFTDGDGAPIHAYRERRNLPALDGTSKLSPHLRHGTLGIRTAHAAALAGAGSPEAASTGGVDTWISELAWRDFYHQWVWYYPHVLSRSFDAAFSDLAYENDQALFAAWCEGRTGYPLVDAAMRQLNHTGWMHNRLRMIVASFLCKDLLCDWRWGEDYFWQHLVDGDKPANVGGWQWSASTGADAQPFFRIFNPTSQSRQFDPDGTFIRTWVPELMRVPTRYLHAPCELPPLEAQARGFKLDREYPAPIVDHHTQRQRALELYSTAKRRGSRHEA